MSPLTLPQLLAVARRQYEAGQLAAAEGLCRNILQADPQCAEALRLLGLSAERAGQLQAAVLFLERGVTAAPDARDALADLARVYHRLGRLDDALACCRRRVERGPDPPDAPDAWRRWADILLEQRDYGQAIEVCQRALTHYPNAVELTVRLGDALQSASRFTEAIAAYRQALTHGAHDPQLHLHLGRAWQHTGRLEEARDAYRQALALDASLVPAHVHLGLTLAELDCTDESAAAYRHALALQPDVNALGAGLPDAWRENALLDLTIILRQEEIARDPRNAQAHLDLAMTAQRRGLLDLAADTYCRALDLGPSHVWALNNLGVLRGDQGRLDEALGHLRQAVALHPEVPGCHGNLLYTLHFHPASDAATLHQEHAIWQQRHAQPLAALHRPHEHDRAPERRLRVGYVSPDFRLHPIGRFLSAFWPAHDHRHFEVVCYSSTTTADEVTARLRQGADRWVPAAHLSDAALADLVRRDRIDILVDLTMHMAHGRLLVFARKPAPVQITYLAYCSTTGLEAMNYRLTDPYLDPPERDDRYYAEESVRLSQCYWCYHPGVQTPPVNPLPALATGRVTFASLNNFLKVSPAALEAWARLLGALPGARLILHTAKGSHRDDLQRYCAARGIAPGRLEFFAHVPIWDYFLLHHRIDLALDSFPYPGGTTTCDALWMGVPTISLVGQPAHTRSGLSILSNVGLPELATAAPEQYLATAVQLAQDLPRLAQLRATLRDRLCSSPLMDAPRFARDLEAVYRSLWRRWCAGPAPS